MFFFLKALSVKVNVEGTGVFPPSLPLAVGLIGTSPAEDPPPRGKDQREQRVRGSPANQQPVGGAGVVPGKSRPIGVFQVGQGVGSRIPV